MFKNKNDYSIIVFDEQNNFVLKWQYVHNLYKASIYLNKKHSHWHYMNVYNRRSSLFLQRFYKGNFIPPKFS